MSGDRCKVLMAADLTILPLCSTFGVAFQEAASASGARTRHDAFEASVVEVRKDDLDKFLVR